MTGSPSTVTRRVTRSSTTPPTVSGASSDETSDARRTTDLMRATTSRGLKGLVM